MPANSQQIQTSNALPEYPATWIDGTVHGVGKHHLQTYLNEFMCRFNRRFYRPISFQSLLCLGVLRPGLTYRAIYKNVESRKSSVKTQDCTSTG